MKDRNIEDRLALLGAVITLFGVTLAAGDALGAEDADAAATAVEIHAVGRNTLAAAERANNEAAERAAASLARETSIDLDIRFEDRTSSLTAGRRKAR